ncbi:M20 family metallopeptidase [Povalibacter sp.]|uniref:M20 family metallopeptidase n=1 Tax=Povalibacter sp. TaxID=1962978 RepID=UPI002F400896
MSLPGPVITFQQAVAMAQSRRGELQDLLFRLVSVRSLSGESAESAQNVVLDFLATLPYEVELTADRPSDFSKHEEFMPPVPEGEGPFANVVARPRGQAGSNSAIFAHIDTHHVVDGWTSNPYQPAVRDGRLYGLGAADGKGGVAAMLIASAALTASGGRAPLLICCHGKGGGSRGSLPVFERLRQRQEPIHAIAYAHPAETGKGLSHVKHVVRGVVDLTLTVTGWLGEPREIGLPDSAPWSESGDALQTCLQAIEHLRGTVLKNYELNVGRLHAGERVGTVPLEAQAQLRLLFDDAVSWPVLVRHIDAELQAFAQLRAAFAFSLEPGAMRSNFGSVAWDAPPSRTVRDAIEQIAGVAPRSYTNHYNGDIRFPLRLLGIPAFGIGSLGGNFYGPNEWVDVDDLVRLVAVLILTTSRWNEGEV